MGKIYADAKPGRARERARFRAIGHGTGTRQSGDTTGDSQGTWECIKIGECPMNS
jgi:hypothetical protein